MTISASSILQRAADILLDETSVRWPADELVRWLNDGQREVIVYRPDATNTTATATLAAGSRQDLDSMSLSPAPAKLLEITRNMAASSAQRSVRLVPRQILDSQKPGWHRMNGSVDIVHYMFDERDPKTFYVYPPALPAAQLEIMYSGIPADIAQPAEGALFGDVQGNLSLPDIYGNAVLDYILYRAFNKDNESAGNAARSATHYSAFMRSLGIEIKATIAAQPQSRPGLQARPMA